jgi:hypothetical protein
VVSLGAGRPAISARGDAAPGIHDAATREFPLITLAHHAGDGAGLGDPWPDGVALPGTLPASDDLDQVILRRGSTRRMDGSASVSSELYRWSMAASMRGLDAIGHVASVHAVDGVEPGLYRWPDLARPVRRGLLRDELLRVCWDQDLGRDACFDVLGVVDLGPLDDTGYREAQIASGIAEGRLHLAAYALGIGASGMTFLDDELEALVGGTDSGC